MLLPLAVLALLLTPPGTPSGGFHWQRIITPPPGAGVREACVVLDAATFANAAPALRDLRLFQDGTELPYVIEESYDERALNSGTTPPDDRSAYEPVYVARLRPARGGKLGNGDPDWEAKARYGYEQRFLIDARVPVERVRVESSPVTAHNMRIAASEAFSSEAETVNFQLGAAQVAWPFTLGANLQHEAAVTVEDSTPGSRSETVTLEMRKRSLCYQPRSANPLILYLGGGEGLAAKTYSLANGFSTALERPFATLGPLEPNPDQQAATRRHLPRLLLSIAILTLALLLTATLATALLQKQKGPPKAAPTG